ncbi:hypothetical protein PsorP6_016533 [Peronosclerospora sorghi]|uniref:Uncharacterized protein n=1 Tax=Peronosclerospora sorghi TaxID=230839 RepID=A0ACC0VM30_9STRA|nr:hypothetical protein PsorP6_016533 [Peronosclerospora sorghi]
MNLSGVRQLLPLLTRLADCQTNAARGYKTPYEVIWDEKLWLDHMRVFGSTDFVYVDQSKRGMFNAKAYRYIFLGYAKGSRAYRVWDCETNRIVVTWTIDLDECPPSEYISAPYTRESQLQWIVLDDHDDPSPTIPRPVNDAMGVGAEATQDGTIAPMEVTISTTVPPTVANQPIGGNALVIGAPHVRAQPPPGERTDCIWWSIPERLRLTDGYEIALDVMEIPRTYKEAMASPQDAEWKEAVRRQLRSHFRNHTWDAFRRPDGLPLIGKK